MKFEEGVADVKSKLEFEVPDEVAELIVNLLNRAVQSDKLEILPLRYNKGQSDLYLAAIHAGDSYVSWGYGRIIGFKKNGNADMNAMLFGDENKEIDDMLMNALTKIAEGVSEGTIPPVVLD